MTAHVKLVQVDVLGLHAAKARLARRPHAGPVESAVGWRVRGRVRARPGDGGVGHVTAHLGREHDFASPLGVGRQPRADAVQARVEAAASQSVALPPLPPTPRARAPPHRPWTPASYYSSVVPARQRGSVTGTG